MAELGERNYGHIELTGHLLDAASDARELLNAVGGRTVPHVHHVNLALLVQMTQVLRHSIKLTTPLLSWKQPTTSVSAPLALASAKTVLR